MGAKQSKEVKDALSYYDYGQKKDPKWYTAHRIAKIHKISPSTMYRALQRRKERKC